MNYIHFALTLAVSFLIASPTPAANPTTADLTLQSQQRLTGMRESLGLDEETHSFQMEDLTQRATTGAAHVRFRQLYHGIASGAVRDHQHVGDEERTLPIFRSFAGH